MRIVQRALAVAVALGGGLVVAVGCNSLIGAGAPTLVDSFDASSGSGGTGGAPAASCLLNSECPNTQICVFRVCSEACAADKDCALGQRCLQTSAGNACVLATAATCANGEACPAGSDCKNGACRTSCDSATNCLTDQVCALGACLGTDSGHDPGTVGGGGTGEGGAAGETGAGGTSQSTGGSGGVTGGSGGSGGAAPECQPDYADCNGLSPLSCQGGKILSAGPDCPYACKAGKCVGECVTDKTQCTGLTFAQCDADNTWQTKTCASVCDVTKGCVGTCTVGSLQCNGATELDVCTAGTYVKKQDCPVACALVGGTSKCIACGDADGLCPTGCKSPTDPDCPKEPGEKCSVGGDCRLGFCVDTVCCNTSSCTGGSCYSCNVTGHAGTCTEVNGSTSTDAANCGACGTVCSANHVTASCVGGACSGACAAGYTDCNTDKRTDGCETSTLTDAANCGGCNQACAGAAAHVAAPSCNAGSCNGTCAAGYADCNANKRTDGCETNTTADANNCGTCASPCKYRECISSACASPTFAGVVGPGPQSQTFATGAITFVKVSLPAAGKLAAIGMTSTLAGAKAYLGLYSDSTGSPQSLVAQTSELTTTASGTEGILSALTPVTKTDYWIALTTNAPSSSALKVACETATTSALYALTPYAALPQFAPVANGLSLQIPDFYVVTVP